MHPFFDSGKFDQRPATRLTSQDGILGAVFGVRVVDTVTPKHEESVIFPGSISIEADD